jgi:hypothetical protein
MDQLTDEIESILFIAREVMGELLFATGCPFRQAAPA